MRTLSVFAFLFLASCASSEDFGQRIVAADKEAQNWLSYGRNYQETRDSPLDQINRGNIPQLRLAWYYDLDTNRGQESTPLIVDGRMYTTSAWSKVQAFDAVNGKLLWQYDPEVPGEAAANSCCDVVNRGAAYWGGKVFVGTIDGRLIAIDAQTGRQLWSTMTVAPGAKNTITGAPRVVKGLVIIGNGGADQGARGYLSAYHVDTGKMAWRFYTVPGEPGKRDGAASDEILEKLARPTWAGKWYTRQGGLGGGTVWDAMAYDPELDLLYIGVGNAGYWNRKVRSENTGDNLFVSSIIALRPETGEYVWHYQEVPGDEWDYTATQHMILANLQINGKTRKVLMQAPKNGFFYVLDRETGELLSAKPYSKVSWADGIDLKTGRPQIRPEARWSLTGKPFLGWPSASGAHNWHPMAYSARTGLVYIPIQDMSNVFLRDDNFKPLAKGPNVGIAPSLMIMPDDPAQKKAIRDSLQGFLIAWDPVRQREVWRARNDSLPNGGVLSTAGGLVLQGDGAGFLNAYEESSGKKLWSYDVGSAALAPPVTWSAGGKQYVSIVVGWGGSVPLSLGDAVLDRESHMPPSTKGRVLTFALGGIAALPAREKTTRAELPPPSQFANAVAIKRGELTYARTCVVCHGMNAVSASAIPDLRYSGAIGDAQSWNAIVRDGVLTPGGMISFKGNFTEAETDEIRAYLIDRAQRAYSERHADKRVK